jgi:sporulation protein YlmC with PRC-barrel domain
VVSVDKLKGTEVFGKRGIKIGKVEDIEIDDMTWAVKVVDVKMDEDIAKIYGEKAGYFKKKIVPLPAAKMGPLSGETITLKEELTPVELENLRSEIRTERPW